MTTNISNGLKTVSNAVTTAGNVVGKTAANFATDKNFQDKVYTQAGKCLQLAYDVPKNYVEELSSKYLMRPLFCENFTAQEPVKLINQINAGVNPYSSEAYMLDNEGYKKFKTVNAAPYFKAEALKSMSEESDLGAKLVNFCKKTVLVIDFASTKAGNLTLVALQGTLGKVPLVGQPLSAAIAFTVRAVTLLVLGTLAALVAIVPAIGLGLFALTGPGYAMLVTDPKINKLNKEIAEDKKQINGLKSKNVELQQQINTITGKNTFVPTKTDRSKFLIKDSKANQLKAMLDFSKAKTEIPASSFTAELTSAAEEMSNVIAEKDHEFLGTVKGDIFELFDEVEVPAVEVAKQETTATKLSNVVASYMPTVAGVKKAFTSVLAMFG